MKPDKCPYCRNGADEQFNCCYYCGGSTELIPERVHPNDIGKISQIAVVLIISAITLAALFLGC
jgi:hypothetical protein